MRRSADELLTEPAGDEDAAIRRIVAHLRECAPDALKRFARELDADPPSVMGASPAGDEPPAAAAGGNPDPLLTAEAAAAYLGITGVRRPGHVVRGLCRRKQLTFVRLARRIMVRRSWLDEYVRHAADGRVAR